jgi:DNA-binding CsgD family transcriptional regulator/tetratricopeptide (TPR) repeat protein
VPVRGVIQSPVLVGRDAFLTLMESRLADAAAGAGRVLFVAGEAGIGKTRLLGSLTRRAQASSFGVTRAAAFPGDVQSLGGLLVDLASDLVSAPEPVLGELGQSITSRIRAIPADAGDAHHRRRLLVQDLADLLVTADPGIPVLIVLEDLHWADELSLDVLGHLAGRIANRPMLIAGAYRSDELYPGLPLRGLRTRLLAQRLAEEVRLPRLGLDQTATMTSATLGRPVPAQLVAAIHARTDGIPLHVEEFLAAIDESSLTSRPGAAVAAAAVPDTLSDAVLSRGRRLSAPTRNVASAAAVIGRSFDFDLLTAVTDAGPDEVAGALRELQEAYFVLPGADAVTFDFRHALIRDTLYADTGLPLRRRLHERVAAAGAERGYRGAFISAHFEQAGCPGPAYEYAVAAAREASAVSAHGEALELCRRAVRSLPVQLPALDQAGVFAALGDEAAATDDNLAAAEAYQTAHELISAAGEVRAAAALVPRMVSVAHLLGAGLDTRVGWQLLEEAIADADQTCQEAEAARGYRMVGSSASELTEYDRAERWLTEGVRYAENAELWNHRHYMASHLAHVQWATGQWDAAAQTAEGALADGRGGITTRITAQYVLGYLAMGRGDWDAAGELLTEALAAGEQMGELQRLSPPLWGLAEVARCQGDYGATLTRCERGYHASAEVMDAACLFPYLITGVRAYLACGDVDAAEEWSGRVSTVLTARAVPGTLPAIGHGQGLILLARGDSSAAHQAVESARDAWRARRRFWEGTWAVRDLAVIASKARRRGEAALLLDETRALAAAAGATTLVDDAERLTRSFGPGRHVRPWHPLSEREYEVAQLVAAGLTNRQIAQRLVVSPKTISAHITHILTKLGAGRRAEIAAWCATIRPDTL